MGTLSVAGRSGGGHADERGEGECRRDELHCELVKLGKRNVSVAENSERLGRTERWRVVTLNNYIGTARRLYGCVDEDGCRRDVCLVG